MSEEAMIYCPLGRPKQSKMSSITMGICQPILRVFGTCEQIPPSLSLENAPEAPSSLFSPALS